MALQLRRKTHESIIYIDQRQRAAHHAFGPKTLSSKILPVGTRVLYSIRL